MYFALLIIIIITNFYSFIFPIIFVLECYFKSSNNKYDVVYALRVDNRDSDVVHDDDDVVDDKH